MKTTYFSEVQSGKLQPSITKRLLNDLKPYEGKIVELTLCKKKSTRSVAQNRLYWAYVTILAKDLGYTKDEMHSLVAYKFLKQQIVIGSEEEIIVKSTTKLTKSEFGDFVSEIQTWASQYLNIHLPSPDEQTMIEL